MITTKINEKGNFETWGVKEINEIKSKFFFDTMGNFLFENDSMKLWDLTLYPNERSPFVKRVSNYTLTCMTDGLALSRNSNGQINLMRFKKGESILCEFEKMNIVSDFQNLGENILKLIVMEHKSKDKKTPTI